MKIQQALELYLESLKKEGVSPRSLYTYGKDAQQIATFFGDNDLSQMTKPRVGKFLKSDALLWVQDKKPRSARTVKKTVYFFRRFLNWSVQQGWIETIPLPAGLSIPKIVMSSESVSSDSSGSEEKTG